MKTGLSVAIVLGFALTLLKGGDLLLRPHQRRAVQALLEEFTLGFDQLSFEQFSRRLTTPEGLFCFTLLAYMELVLGTIVMLFARSDAVKSDALDWGSAPVEVVGNFVMIGLTLGLLATAWKWPLPMLMSWLLKDARSRRVLLLRFVALIVLGYLFLAICQFVLLGLGVLMFPPSGDESFSPIPWKAAGVVIWLLFLIFWILVNAMVLLLAGSFGAPLIFRFVRGVLWRIVEYEKGRVFGVILGVTILLTVIKESLF